MVGRYTLFASLVIFSLACGSPEQEAFLDVAGHKIHIKETGTGPPLILAHGGYLNLDMWIANEYEKRIPQAEKRVVEDAAHLINWEKPQAFNSILRSILHQ